MRLEKANSGLDTKQWYLLKLDDQEDNCRILVSSESKYASVKYNGVYEAL
jgi:hypothetical protein